MKFSVAFFSGKSLKSALAATLSLGFISSQIPFALAAPGDVNSVNNGQVVQGGTYYNTAGDKTTFVNSGGGGLWIKSGTTVTGLEVSNTANPVGSLTGNGGHLHFYAPNSVVRVDGNINVNGLVNGGYATANGGKVTVDAAFYYQQGQISAFGNNGGVVQFNVGSAVFSPDASIDARGLNGAGGQINVQADNFVSLQKNAARAPVFNTSGQTIGTYDTNIINIQGALVNMDGILKADGTVLNAQVSDGGTVRLIATGGNSSDVTTLIASSDQFATDAVEINAHVAQVSGSDGAVYHGGEITANGADAPDNLAGANGGTVYLQASESITHQGTTQANAGDGGDGRNGNAPVKGGNGGNVVLNAGTDITLNNTIEVNGGKGGTNKNTVTESDSDNGLDIGNGQKSTIADASTLVGADGGDGGFVGFKYDGNFNKNAHVYAVGGKGGTGANAIVRDTHDAAPHQTAIAEGTAIGGNGGNGGNGGTIVFDGASHPVGNAGTMYANGGDGGNGGSATSRVWAFAFEDGNGNRAETATVTANATGGLSGNAGQGGTIVAHNPGALNSRYRIQSGLKGETGRASAEAIAIGIRKSRATANASGANDSRSEAISIDIRRNGGVIRDNANILNDLKADNTLIFNNSGDDIKAIFAQHEPRFRLEVAEGTGGNSVSGRNTGGDSVDAISRLSIVPSNSTRINDGQYSSNVGATPLQELLQPLNNLDLSINEPLGFSLASLLNATTDNTVSVADLFSLFQESRGKGINIDELKNNTHNRPLLGYKTSNLFLVSAYKSVTQEILTLAEKEYSFQLAQGLTPELAIDKTIDYLKQAGLDKETAGLVLEALEDDTYRVNSNLKIALEKLTTQ